MEVAFDHIAQVYDTTFTLSSIGKYQRQCVWDKLDKTISTHKPLHILEINCGTGTDAILFAKKGHQVLGTDISEEMLKVAHDKVVRYSLSSNVRLFKLDLREIDSLMPDKKFDLIFSNFGGLNCIEKNDLSKLPEGLSHLLSPKGKVIAVIMPKLCIWESLYFTLKLQFSKSFRRLTNKGISAGIGNGFQIMTWYYSPAEIGRIFSKDFKVLRTSPIGIALPPSYLEPFFKKKQGRLAFLFKCEKCLNKLSFLSFASDHYMVEFEKRIKL